MALYRNLLLVSSVFLLLSAKAQKGNTDISDEGMASPSFDDRYALPVISIGGGATFYTGNINSDRTLSKFSGVRWGTHAEVEQRFGKWVGVKGRIFYGKTAGEKHTFSEFDNFQSRLISGDVRFSVHFDQIVGKRQAVSPYFSVGAGYMNFRSKSDMKNADELSYYLWDDGILRDQTQSNATNGNPQKLDRDYTYETTVIASGNAFLIPVEAGLRFKMHDFIDLGLGYSHQFLLNRFLPGQTGGIDHFGYLSANLYWYLGSLKK